MGAREGVLEGTKAGFEKRLTEYQGKELSEEQKLQIAQALQNAREKTKNIQKEKTEAKRELRKKI